MANEFLGEQALDDTTPVSAFSGTKDLPEVRDIQGWLSGKYNTGNDFRDMALNDVIEQRKSSLGPLHEQTISEAIGKKVFYSKGGDDMNKVGEFFYSIKDSLATALESIPMDIVNFGASAVKAVDPKNETATKALKTISDVRKTENFNKELRDFRLGVEADALSNEFAGVLGQMASLIIAGAATGGGAVVAAAGEGLAEGGQMLQTTIDDYAERAGGLDAYAGEGITAASMHGGISGLIGYRGVEAKFLKKLGKFGASDFIQGVAGEALEEGLQYVSERTFRRADNAIRGDNIDEMSWKDEIKSLGHNMLMGALGGATIGGVAVVNNRIRMREVIQDTFNLPEVEADALIDEHMASMATEVAKNTQAIAEIQNPESPVVQKMREVVAEKVSDGDNVNESKQDRVMERAQNLVVMQQHVANEPMADSPVLSSDPAVSQPAIENVVEQAAIEVETIEAAEQQARNELAELEAKQVSPLREELHAQEIVQKQAEIDAIREMDGREPEFSVGENVNQEAITELKNQIESDIIEQTELNSADPDLAVGATLLYDDRFDTGEKATSRFSQRIYKETGENAGRTYNVRKDEPVRQAADKLALEDEGRVLRFLQDRTVSQLEGLSKPELLEALYRKHKGNAAELTKLDEFSFIATEFGRGVRAFAEKSEWDAAARIRSINNQLEREAPKSVKKKVAEERKSFREALKVKKEKLPSDAEIERMTRKLLGCK